MITKLVTKGFWWILFSQKDHPIKIVMQPKPGKRYLVVTKIRQKRKQLTNKAREKGKSKLNLAISSLFSSYYYYYIYINICIYIRQMYVTYKPMY